MPTLIFWRHSDAGQPNPVHFHLDSAFFVAACPRLGVRFRLGSAQAAQVLSPKLYFRQQFDSETALVMLLC
jgi:hypothetical protein